MPASEVYWAPAEGDVEWAESVELAPVAPGRVRERLEDRTLATVDLPARVEHHWPVEVETATALYRLVQLFGTPNVPGFEAGASMPDREATTWRYLFSLTGDPLDERLLVSVHDYRTNPSFGVAGWRSDGGGPTLPEPAPEAAGVAVPGEETVRRLGLLLATTFEQPVQATYRGLWV